MSEKIELKDKLAAVDLNYKGLWDELTDDQRKSLKQELYILNRYVSNVNSNNRQLQEHYLLAVNEYFNKNWNDLQKHPKLLWMLLCMCGHESKKIFFHQWMGMKKKSGSNAKVVKFLQQIYPSRKDDEIELLAKIMTTKEVKELAKDYGYDDREITKMF